MIVIIPLGGIGKRFKDLGFKSPKPLINVLGKPILYWLLDSINVSKIDEVLIPYNKELKNYRLEDRLRKDYPYINFRFLCLKNNTEGAAETILVTLNKLNIVNTIKDTPILCLDGDNFYLSDVIGVWAGQNCVYVFEDHSPDPIYSYVKIDSNNKIIDMVEKVKISNYASTGAYGFNSWKNLRDYCQRIVDNNIKQKEEYYTSTIIREMLHNDIPFGVRVVEKEKYICLGTPFQVRVFCNNYPRIHALTLKCMITPRRYCFDLDNTLVTYPVVDCDYTTVQPIQKHIEFVRYLKRLGHTIIIYTARRMKSHKGNTGKVMRDIGKITFDTLDDFGIEYDEIYFGKPQADYYIDDLAISAYDDLEKELGYYIAGIPPRHFNSLSASQIETYVKTSLDLSGEIYFYLNIPTSIKDMFPLFIMGSPDNTTYEIERIVGVSSSRLYLSEELTVTQLDNIINSIQRLHETKIAPIGINIYANYSSKMRERYENYDYSPYSDSDVIYNELMESLETYERENKGNAVLIHGDPVLTNIMLNSLGKIKFIDMRGKQGSKLTLIGDWLYDWAKLYQSLIGYDEILMDTSINNNYKSHMIKQFEQRFLERGTHDDLENIRLICKSLLFSMIPLHQDTSKQGKYYSLIESL